MKTENTPNLGWLFLKKNSYLCTVQQMINMESIKTTVTLWLLCLFTVAPACMKTSEVHATVTRTQIIVNRVFTNYTWLVIIKTNHQLNFFNMAVFKSAILRHQPHFFCRAAAKNLDGKQEPKRTNKEPRAASKEPRTVKLPRFFPIAK